MTIVAEPTRLREFVESIFTAAGSNASEAREIADHLVEANLAGHDSHGVGMVPSYLRHLREGHVQPNRTPVRVGGTGPFAVFDAQMGYGQPAVNAVMAEAAKIAREHGVAVTTLRNSQHVGRVGAYAERLLAQGLMSIHFVNAVYETPSVAPFRGSDARLMTNPVCVAIPGAKPVLLDFATSTVALGKVRVAYNKGEPVAPGRLIDRAGRPTTDPKVMFEEPRGAQTAFGEHKGWALAFVAEVLGGAMAGGPRSGDGFEGRRGLVNGMMSIVVEPGRLIDGGWFDGAVATLVDYVKASPPAEPDRPVLVPGEPERDSRAARGRDGIPIDPTTWAQIVGCAQALGLVPPEFTAAAR
jgi:hydroxycarboxylate dehydrogenase B